jgi:TetR/AcrR family transcriptional regulator, cholesterol catabolism regulator
MGGEKQKAIKTQIENPELVEKKHLQIVSAANELFSEKGYHKTTMRDISAASGIELSYLYKYISGKNDILYLFYKYLHSQWRKSFQELAESDRGDPVEQLKEFIRSFLSLAEKYNSEIRTMYTESRHLDKDWLHMVLSLESKNTKALEAFLIRGVEAGVFQIEDTFLTANLIQYLLVIRALRGWNFKNRFGFDRFVRLMADYVLRSLGVSKGPRNPES